MKKKFALIMCAVMLFGAMLTCIPASAAAKTEGGPLAITEVCYAPEDEKYEFIEITNISNSEIDIKDYHIYRFGFSNTAPGNWHVNGTWQMFGLNNQTCAHLHTLNLSEQIRDTNVDTKLAKNEIAVLWIASSASKDESVAEFKNYWTARGSSMTNVNVIKVAAYDIAGTDLHPAKTVNGKAGNSWIPDEAAGFVISLIHKDFEATDTNLMDKKAATTRTRHEAADTEAYVILDGGAIKNTSVHFYGFATKSKFDAAAANAPESVEGDTRYVAEYLPAGLMVFESSDPTKDNVTGYENKADTTDMVWVTFNNQYLPNPGTLYDGQMGLSGELRVADAANGVGSIVLNPSVKPVVENLAVINDEEPEETTAPETTKAAETTAAPAEEKKRCGASITIASFAVLATVGTCAAVVSKKRKDD